MNPLLQTFIDIALWRKGPQDLPASRFLATAVLAVYVLISLVLARLFEIDLRAAVVMIAIDVLMLAAWLWGVLSFFGRRQRFIQTATAVLGVGVLLSLLDIVVRTVQLVGGMADSRPEGWALLSFVAFALVQGRIFMHALERSLLTGIALTVAIVYSIHGVAQLAVDRLASNG